MRITNQSVLTLASATLFCGIAAGQDATSTQSSSETRLRSGDVRASHLLGAEVKRLTGDSVGQVQDLIVSADSDVRLAVISVGGLLGVGDKTIALPFDEFQVAPDGATLYLTLSGEELSARPAFDLENVTAAARSPGDEPAAPAQQSLPDAVSPGFVPSNTVSESFVNESAESAELESAHEAEQPQQHSQLAAEQAQVAGEPQVAAEAQVAAGAQVAEEAQLAAQAQQAQQSALEAEAELVQQAHQAQPAQQAQPDAYPALSKTKASNQPASALIGKEVVDTQNVAVGKVNDVVVTAEPPEVQVIVQLSEELGGGAKLVAVPLPELTISQGAAQDAREINRVETELTVAQLEALPQFQY
jgi:sporulation protein YlmC with PRC-barrel domain